VSGIGPLVEAAINFINSFGIGYFPSDYTDKNRRKREEAEWREKHGSKWRDMK